VADLFHSVTISQLAVKLSVWLLISIAVWINSRSETSEKQWLNLNDLSPFFLKILLDLFLEHGHPLLSVLIRNKTIMENSETFVRPKLDHIVVISNGLRIRLVDSCKHL
jgi:hypothetical protein